MRGTLNYSQNKKVQLCIGTIFTLEMKQLKQSRINLKFLQVIQHRNIKSKKGGHNNYSKKLVCCLDKISIYSH